MCKGPIVPAPALKAKAHPTAITLAFIPILPPVIHCGLAHYFASYNMSFLVLNLINQFCQRLFAV
ncbi:hypothetical protein LDG_8825 [Legionella drancourtii LLAP12]|uniref:Uncharacterized protein n=1 Tax=Legionella drancourtii LLAP12 TaxID=658187 RepID=G9EU35_9GAMM|nr:hypothetical protein LDG_8825 [Legionella drancourtii LLAP12]